MRECVRALRGVGAGVARPAVCVWGARTCAGDRPVAGTPGLLVFRNTWRLQHTARAAHTRGPRHTSAHAACTCYKGVAYLGKLLTWVSAG